MNFNFMLFYGVNLQKFLEDNIIKQLFTMTYIPKIHVCYVGLELSLQLDFLDSVVREDKDPLKELYGGKIAPRKVKINISSLR